jgi:hypothetical protein
MARGQSLCQRLPSLSHRATAHQSPKFKKKSFSSSVLIPDNASSQKASPVQAIDPVNRSLTRFEIFSGVLHSEVIFYSRDVTKRDCDFACKFSPMAERLLKHPGHSELVLSAYVRAQRSWSLCFNFGLLGRLVGHKGLAFLDRRLLRAGHVGWTIVSLGYRDCDVMD